MSQKLICSKHEKKEIEFLLPERLEFLCSICLKNEKLNKNDLKMYFKEEFNEDLKMIEEKLKKLSKRIEENLKVIQDFRFKNLLNSKEIKKFFCDSLDFFKNPLDSIFTLKFFQSPITDNLFAKSSDILKSHPNSLYLYELFKSEGKQIKNVSRIYKASDYQFEADKFHEICDDKGPTLVVVQAKGSNRVFGGYASKSWTNVGIEGDIDAPGSFIFQLDFKTKHIIYQQEKCAICSDPDSNPMFGDHYDFILSNKCNLFIDGVTPISWSNLGNTYTLPLKNAIDNSPNPNNEYMTFQSDEARSYLAGSFKFEVSEFEVFTISFV